MRQWIAFQLGRTFLFFFNLCDPDMAFKLLKDMTRKATEIKKVERQQERYRKIVGRKK